MNSHTFLKLFKEGDNIAFKLLFNKLNHRLVGYMMNKGTWSIEEVEDLVAECWYKVFLNREKFESLDHIKNFCFLVCRNGSINAMRSNSNNQKVIDDLIKTMDKYEMPYSDNRFDQMIPYLRDQIELLEPRKRQVIKMNVIENAKLPDIAKKMNITMQNCYNIKCRALAIIRDKLLSIEHLFSY